MLVKNLNSSVKHAASSSAISVLSLDEAIYKYKGEITSSLEPMEKQLKTIHTALAQIDTRSREISDQRMTIEASIHDTVRKLHEILDVRKTELIGQLYTPNDSKEAEDPSKPEGQDGDHPCRHR